MLKFPVWQKSQPTLENPSRKLEPLKCWTSPAGGGGGAGQYFPTSGSRLCQLLPSLPPDRKKESVSPKDESHSHVKMQLYVLVLYMSLVPMRLGGFVAHLTEIIYKFAYQDVGCPRRYKQQIMFWYSTACRKNVWFFYILSFLGACNFTQTPSHLFCEE